MSISAVVPAGVVWTEQYGQVDGVLLAEEQELLTSRVAPERRREFAAGRSCARSALNQLGLPVGPILRGDAGRPLWPPQAVGSITHCRGYCAAAAAPADRFTALGIDAEINEALPPGVLSYFAGERELRWLASAPSGSLHWDKLLYAIKESVFKAWYPLSGSLVDPRDIEVAVNFRRKIFDATVFAVVPGSERSAGLRIKGRYAAGSGLLLTAAALPA